MHLKTQTHKLKTQANYQKRILNSKTYQCYRSKYHPRSKPHIELRICLVLQSKIRNSKAMVTP